MDSVVSWLTVSASVRLGDAVVAVSAGGNPPGMPSETDLKISLTRLFALAVDDVAPAEGDLAAGVADLERFARVVPAISPLGAGWPLRRLL